MRNVKLLATLALSASVAAGAASLPGGEQDKKLPSGAALLEYVETIKPSVVSIIATDREGRDVASGSGVIIGDGQILTDHQVIARGVAARAILSDGTEAPITDVAVHDTDLNLAVVNVDFSAASAESRAVLPMANEDAEEGLELLLVTKPHDRQHSMALGAIHAVEEYDRIGTVFRVKTQYPSGSSGSPFVNGAGEVAAIAITAFINGAHQKVALPATSAQKLVASQEDTVPVSLTDYHTSMASTLIDTDAALARAIDPSEIKLEATFDKQDDGSLLVDDTYIVKGSGTKEDPYRVTWDLLVSAARVYQPREGLNELPERITFLDNKWVRLDGFIAYPLLAQTSRELTLMLNQWDGCCIGIPPTPYDAIEVTLREEMDMEGGVNVFNYGQLTGLFKVDPYVINKWLVGLYLLEDAELKLEM